jgi:hypothetical protein
MRRYDNQLPEDLRGIAERLTAARVTPSEFELDALRQRVHARAQHMAAARRSRGAAVVSAGGALTVGLVLASGGGVAIAGGATNTIFGGGGGVQSAALCENSNPWTKSYKYEPKAGDPLTVTLTWSGIKLEAALDYTGSYTYQFAGGLVHTASGPVSVTAPNGATSLKIVANGQTETITITYY